MEDTLAIIVSLDIVFLFMPGKKGFVGKTAVYVSMYITGN